MLIYILILNGISILTSHQAYNKRKLLSDYHVMRGRYSLVRYLNEFDGFFQLKSMFQSRVISF